MTLSGAGYLADMGEEQHQRSGRDAVDARRLGQRRGTVTFELLPNLIRKTCYGREVDCSRDGCGLVFLEGEDACLLPVEIDRIPRIDLKPFGRESWDRR